MQAADFLRDDVTRAEAMQELAEALFGAAAPKDPPTEVQRARALKVRSDTRSRRMSLQSCEEEVAAMRRRMCNDSMSDRTSGSPGWSGCCLLCQAAGCISDQEALSTRARHCRFSVGDEVVTPTAQCMPGTSWFPCIMHECTEACGL